MTQRQHILIVDDNQDHREMLIDAFKEYYDISYADSKEKCLSLIQKNAYDLIILDYYLKHKFSGIETLKDITKNHPHIPVIMVTAYGDEDIAISAMKSGAINYIKKTLDQSFINKLKINIKDILSQKENFNKNEKNALLQLFAQHKQNFFNKWYKKLKKFESRINLDEEIIIEKKVLDTLFSAFLADIQNESAYVTCNIFKKMIWAFPSKKGSLVLVELLNTSFKEASREILQELFPESFDGRAAFMQRIGRLVDENDLELSKEYEKIVETSTKKMLQAERMATKLVIMRTLQHEIRQPLSFIYNSIELLLSGEYKNSFNQVLSKILQQTQKIEQLLSKLEKDSQMPLKNYADKLPMINVAEVEE